MELGGGIIFDFFKVKNTASSIDHPTFAMAELWLYCCKIVSFWRETVVLLVNGGYSNSI